MLAVVYSSSRLAGVGVARSPTNIFDPAATPAHSIFGLSMLVLSVTLVIFLLVGGLLFYVLIRYRERPDRAFVDGDTDPDCGDAVPHDDAGNSGYAGCAEARQCAGRDRDRAP